MKKLIIPFFCIFPVFTSAFIKGSGSSYFIIFAIFFTSLYIILSLFYVVHVHKVNNKVPGNFYHRINSRDFGVNNYFIIIIGLFAVLIAGAGNVDNNNLLLIAFVFVFTLSRMILFSMWMNSRKLTQKSTV